jgi:hypothetical protein
MVAKNKTKASRRAENNLANSKLWMRILET